MCGRYGADDKVNEWLTRRCRGDLAGLLRAGDIRPGERVPALVAGLPAPRVLPMTWGIRSNGSLIINARKETIAEKPTFRHLIQNRRCLLPASRFYEWDSEKHKAAFCGEDAGILFLAGVYRPEPEGGRFVVITAPADKTVAPVHDRMPVLIPEAFIDDWLSDAGRAKELLNAVAVPLRRERDTEQLCLWNE